MTPTEQARAVVEALESVPWDDGRCPVCGTLEAHEETCELSDALSAARALLLGLEREQGSGVELIAVERRRQVEVEGWTPEHDDEHVRDELAQAAACYALPIAARTGQSQGEAVTVEFDILRSLWPWWESVEGPRGGAIRRMAWWKPATAYHSPVFAGVWDVKRRDRIRELTKAGALIAAEIDRIQRAAPPESPEEEPR